MSVAHTSLDASSCQSTRHMVPQDLLMMLPLLSIASLSCCLSTLQSGTSVYNYNRETRQVSTRCLEVMFRDGEVSPEAEQPEGEITPNQVQHPRPATLRLTLTGHELVVSAQ